MRHRLENCKRTSAARAELRERDAVIETLETREHLRPEPSDASNTSRPSIWRAAAIDEEHSLSGFLPRSLGPTKFSN